MGYIFDILIPALIIFGVAFVWLRTLFSRYLPGRMRGADMPRRRLPGSPRSFMESGGMVPSGRKMATITPADSLENRVDLEHVEDRPPRPARDRREQAPAAKPSSANRIRRALGSRESVRTSFMVKEVLDPPLGIRHRD